MSIGQQISLELIAKPRGRCIGLWAEIARKVATLPQGTGWRVSKNDLPQGFTTEDAQRSVRRTCSNLGFKICARVSSNSVLFWKRDNEYTLTTHGAICRVVDKDEITQ